MNGDFVSRASRPPLKLASGMLALCERCKVGVQDDMDDAALVYEELRDVPIGLNKTLGCTCIFHGIHNTFNALVMAVPELDSVVAGLQAVGSMSREEHSCTRLLQRCFDDAWGQR